MSFRHEKRIEKGQTKIGVGVSGRVHALISMSSCWGNFHHWLHWKLWEWQLPMLPVMEMSSKWPHFCFEELCDISYKPKQTKWVLLCVIYLIRHCQVSQQTDITVPGHTFVDTWILCHERLYRIWHGRVYFQVNRFSMYVLILSCGKG